VKCNAQRKTYPFLPKTISAVFGNVPFGDPGKASLAGISSHSGQLSLTSLRGRKIEYWPA